jgi:alpha-1,3-mannosyl-glycoprotein beta-1,2-N-acetylglucosaminyltransferase
MSHRRRGNFDNDDDETLTFNHVYQSNKPKNGMSKPSLFAYKYTTTGIIIFRAAIAVVILLCILWGCLIIKIATDIGNDEGQHHLPRGLIARPKIDNGHRFGNRLRRTLKRIELRLEGQSPMLDVDQMVSPLLVFTFKRADYLERAMWKLYERHPAQKYVQQRANRQDIGRIIGAPIIISQDGDDPEVKAVIEAYREAFEINLGIPLYRIEHNRPPEDKKKENEFDSWHADPKPYQDLARHYGWALEQTFSGSAYDLDTQHDRRSSKPPLPKRVVILEEDIEVGIDFFSLMNATADILDSDETLLAVSGYNDNGLTQHVADPKRLVRSDFFPGLGWMMPRRVWDGVESHPNTALKISWAPHGYWDDWIREPNIRLGRQVLRPEVSRTFHFGNIHGVSQNSVNYNLNQMLLDRVDVRWEKEDLSYLKPEWFSQSYWNRVANAKLVSTEADAKYYIAHSDVRLVYTSLAHFESLAFNFDIMTDEKAGIARTGYEGIVEVRYGKGQFILFLTPPYVSEGSPPSTFGNKAWMNLDKTTLLQGFGLLND